MLAHDERTCTILFDCRDYLKAKSKIMLPVQEAIVNKSLFCIIVLAQKFNFIWYEVGEKKGWWLQMQGDEKMTKWDKQRADKDSPDWGISMYSPNGRMMTLLRLLLLWLFSVLLTPPPICTPTGKMPEWDKTLGCQEHRLIFRLGFFSHVHLFFAECFAKVFYYWVRRWVCEEAFSASR